MTPQKLIDELYDAVENDDMYSRSYLVYAVEDLCAENEKLRELVRNLYACINNRDCDYCEYVDEACEFERNMRELGVDA